jgi:hypothetical protein
MRPVLAAAAITAVVVIVYFGGPPLPVLVGAVLGGAWCAWRALKHKTP